MKEELEGVKNRVSGAEYEIQTLKDQVTYLREQVKELYRVVRMEGLISLKGERNG